MKEKMRLESQDDDESPRAHSLRLWLDAPSLAFDCDRDDGPPSEQQEEDWKRAVACGDPWAVFSSNTPTVGRMYTPGTMSGGWTGLLAVRDTYIFRRVSRWGILGCTVMRSRLILSHDLSVHRFSCPTAPGPDTRQQWWRRQHRSHSRDRPRHICGHRATDTGAYH